MRKKIISANKTDDLSQKDMQEIVNKTDNHIVATLEKTDLNFINSVNCNHTDTRDNITNCLLEKNRLAMCDGNVLHCVNGLRYTGDRVLITKKAFDLAKNENLINIRLTNDTIQPEKENEKQYKYAVLHCECTDYVTKLTKSEYPKLDDLFQAEGATSFSLDINKLLPVCAQFIRDKKRVNGYLIGMKWQFDFRKATLSVMLNCNQLDSVAIKESLHKIPITNLKTGYESDNFKTCFDSEYLFNSMKFLNLNEITFKVYHNNYRPLFMESQNKTALIMPIRLE